MRKPAVKSSTSRAPWFRVWREALHNSKFRSLSHEQRSYWLLLSMMTDGTGRLPSLRQVAYNLQTSDVSAQAILDDMVGLELIDVEGGLSVTAKTFRMHDWDQWQPSAEDSKERVRKHRTKLRVRKHREKAKLSDRSNVTVTLRNGYPSVSVSSTEHVSSSVARAESVQGSSHEVKVGPETSPRPTGRPARGGRS